MGRGVKELHDVKAEGMTGRWEGSSQSRDKEQRGHRREGEQIQQIMTLWQSPRDKTS